MLLECLQINTCTRALRTHSIMKMNYFACRRMHMHKPHVEEPHVTPTRMTCVSKNRS